MIAITTKLLFANFCILTSHDDKQHKIFPLYVGSYELVWRVHVLGFTSFV